MHYNLKDSEKFTQTLEALEQIIGYENDKEIVEIHADIAISSPRGTNNLVLEYKQMLRTRAAVWAVPEAVIEISWNFYLKQFFIYFPRNSRKKGE